MNMMSKYPEEIVKAAEKLIEEHKGTDPLNVNPRGPFMDAINKHHRSKAIKAAIISCKFAIEKIGKWKDFGCLMVKEQSEQIQKYLEELL